MDSISSSSSSSVSGEEYPLTEVVTDNAPASFLEEFNTDPISTRPLWEPHEEEWLFFSEIASSPSVLGRVALFIEKRPIVLALPGFIAMLAGISRGSLVDLSNAGSMIGLGLTIAGVGGELTNCIK